MQPALWPRSPACRRNLPLMLAQDNQKVRLVKFRHLKEQSREIVRTRRTISTLLADLKEVTRIVELLLKAIKEMKGNSKRNRAKVVNILLSRL